MRPTQYEITVSGEVGPTLVAAFEGFSVSTSPMQTRIRGRILDQAALHGLLERIESLGLELLDVRRVDPLA